MSGFEFVSVFFSVVVGLATTRIMGGIAALVEARRRVRLFWIHVIWICNIFMMNLQIWWGTWGLMEFHNWNFRAFGLVVTVPGTLYLLSDLLVPNEIERTGEVSMLEHYETVRPIFFLLLAIYNVCSIAANYFLFDVPVLSPFTAIPAGMALGALLCMLSGNKILHAVYAFLSMAGLILFVSIDKQVIR